MQRFCPRGAIPFHQLSWWLGLSAVNGICSRILSNLRGIINIRQEIWGGIKINFVHYESFDEGVSKWKQRKERINWDNLFIVGSEKDGCTYETIQRFERLPYENKVILTHVDYPEFKSAYYIKGFEDRDEMGTTINYKKTGQGGKWKRQ